MKCKDIQYQLADYLDKQLPTTENSIIEKHLETCTDCKKELQELTHLFTALSTAPIEESSAALRNNFEELLAKEKQELDTKVIPLQPTTNNWQSYLRVAASILIVVSAFLLGKFASGNTEYNIDQSRTAEVLAQFQDQSASKRIQAVNTSEEFTNKDKKIIEALIGRLYFDKNTSVRLAAVEALSKFTSEEMVKTALIKSLETDKDPAIQIELIQILTKIQEKRAIEPMKKLLDNKDVPSYVKQELQSNLPNLL